MNDYDTDLMDIDALIDIDDTITAYNEIYEAIKRDGYLRLDYCNRLY